MMSSVRLFVALVLLLGASAKVSYKGYQVIRAEPRDQTEREFLRLLGDKYELRFWRKPERRIGPVDMLVPDEKLLPVKDLLILNRIPFDIMISDVDKAILAQVTPRRAQLTLAEFDYNKYHTFAEIEKWTEDFAMAHKEYLTRMEVGKSYENRTFYALKISSGGPDTKREFAIDCGIHADEWIGPATCLHVIKFLTAEVGKSTKVGKILEKVDFYIIPSANPDGYEYSWTTDRMWRKTRSATPKANCIGVDPNRNWDSNFGGNGSSSEPCSAEYHGPHAWSEANVRSQRDFVNGLKNLIGYIDVHSYSQLWMFPYGFTFDKPRDFELLSEIANMSVNAIKDVHGQVYTPGQIAKVIFVASGSTADYFYDHLKLRCVFAAELRDKGKHGMLLPESEIQPTAEEAFAGLMTIASYIADGECDLN